MKTNVTHDIAIQSILKVLLVLIGLWFLFVIRDIIAIAFVSIIMAAALNPVIDRMTSYRIPRGLTIVLAYFLIMGILGAIIYFIIPPMIFQLKQLATQLPNYYSYFSEFISSISQVGNGAVPQESVGNISSFLNNITDNLFSTTKGFISGFTALLTIFVLTLYMLLDEEGIKHFFIALLPAKQRNQIVDISHKVGNGLGAWLRGQLLLGLMVGILVYIGLVILQVPYALTLAMLAGVLELIPVIGPIISAIPAILLALSVSPTLALMVTIFYLLVQEVENKLLVPKVMQRSVGLHPVTIIIVLLIGAKLMGITGMLLSVPVTTMIYIILKEWTTINRRPTKK